MFIRLATTNLVYSAEQHALSLPLYTRSSVKCTTRDRGRRQRVLCVFYMFSEFCMFFFFNCVAKHLCKQVKRICFTNILYLYKRGTKHFWLNVTKVEN